VRIGDLHRSGEETSTFVVWRTAPERPANLQGEPSRHQPSGRLVVELCEQLEPMAVSRVVELIDRRVPSQRFTGITPEFRVRTRTQVVPIRLGEAIHDLFLVSGRG
jgi:hypothetical protein